MVRKLIAEAVGTFILVFFGAGAAIVALKPVADGAPPLGVLGVALAFGLTLTALAYAIGPISGCHVNPAVTIGVLINKGIDAVTAGGYIVAQLIGATIAGGVLKLVTAGFGGVKDTTEGLGTNGWKDPVTTGGAFVVELVLTFLLVFVVLQVTSKEGSEANPGFAGIPIGFALAVIHFVGIPVTGTSVNPARSFGPAVFNPSAFGQLWLFVVAPIVGAVVAALIHKALQANYSEVDAKIAETTKA